VTGVLGDGGFGVIGVSGGVPGSSVNGRSQCRVVAFSVSGLRESDFLFITISHCAWRHCSGQVIVDTRKGDFTRN